MCTPSAHDVDGLHTTSTVCTRRRRSAHGLHDTISWLGVCRHGFALALRSVATLGSCGNCGIEEYIRERKIGEIVYNALCYKKN